MNSLKNIKRFNNIKEIIYNSADLYSENIAFTTKIIDNGRKKYIDTTYQDFLSDINYFGAALYRLGLKGKRVIIVGFNSYKWAVSHFSNMLGGIMSVPLDKGLQLEELEESIIRSEAEAIIFDNKLKDTIITIKDYSKTNLKHYICMDDTTDFISWDRLIEDSKNNKGKEYDEYINYEVDANEMSILLFTSGTTSKSKAVMLNQYGIATNIYDMQLTESFYNTDVNIAFLPFHHIFGLTGMLVMISSGVKTVFTDGLRYIKQNLVEYKVSVFVGVPALLDKMYSGIIQEIEKQCKTRLINIFIKISNMLLKLHIDVRRILFKKIINQLGGKMRFIISGGAPLDRNTAKWFNEIGIHLVQGYGLTETSPVISAENDNFVRYGSVGIPLKNTKVEIANKDENGIGEIIVKGPNVMLGYYKDEEQTNTVIKDEWFHTGDLGYIDKDGFLYITGRIKDIIVLKNGKKVFPEELEILINRIDEVEECFVYGLPDNEDINNVRVAVEVVYKENNKTDKDELHKIIWNKIKEINKGLPKYKYIKNLLITNEPLIKTTTNKVKRKEEFKKIMKNNTK